MNKMYKHVELWFPDLYGRLMSLSVPGAWLESKTGDGVLRKNFDGSSVAGFATIDDSDLWLLPDLETLRLLPWKADTVAVFGNVAHPVSGPYKDGDTRYCLRNLLHRRLSDERKGLVLQVSVELEFFVFDYGRDTLGSAELDAKGYFDLPSLGLEERFLESLIQHCDAMAIRYDQIHHEAAKSQFEIVLSAMEPVAAADEIMRARHVVRQVAREWGYTADFAPKPIQDQDGSGLHIALALLEDGKDALAGQDENGLSIVGRSFLAGLRRHGRALMPTTNQWVNSYKRLQRGFDAPLYLEASRGLKHTAIQVKKPVVSGKPLWIELTHPDAGCNPYLALAGLIGAGLAGEDDPKLPIYTTQLELEQADQAKHLIAVPGSLHEALEAFENSDQAKEVCGEGVWRRLLDAKQREWNRFAKAVTDWEREHYLPVL